MEIKEETELVQTSEYLTALLIDSQITSTVTETFTEYKMQVMTAQAIEDRLDEMAGEMVAAESNSLLRQVLTESIEQVGFE